jgi:hypothetical protein
MCIRAAAAEVPAERTFARYLCVDIDRLREVSFLGRLVDGLVVDPAVAVTRNLPGRLPHRGHRFRVTLQCHRNAKYGYGETALREHPVQPPEARTRSVLVKRFHVHVTLAGIGNSADNIGQERFRSGVAVKHTVFCALFVIYNELHGGSRSMRPARIGRPCTVAVKIARIPALAHSIAPAPARYQRSIRLRSSSVMFVRLPIGMTRVTTVW